MVRETFVLTPCQYLWVYVSIELNITGTCLDRHYEPFVLHSRRTICMRRCIVEEQSSTAFAGMNPRLPSLNILLNLFRREREPWEEVVIRVSTGLWPSILREACLLKSLLIKRVRNNITLPCQRHLIIISYCLEIGRCRRVVLRLNEGRSKHYRCECGSFQPFNGCWSVKKSLHKNACLKYYYFDVC